MAITAKLRYLRIAPRKVRLVADLIRGKSVEEAQNILNFTQKKTAEPFSKLLKQAIPTPKIIRQLADRWKKKIFTFPRSWLMKAQN